MNRYTDAMDRVIGWMGGIGFVALLCLNAYEFGQDAGYRKAALSMRCNSHSGYSIVDTKTGKCVNGRKG